MPRTSDNFTLNPRPEASRRQFKITSLIYHSLWVAQSARGYHSLPSTTPTPIHNGQRHLFSNYGKKTPKIIPSRASRLNNKTNLEFRTTESMSKNDSVFAVIRAIPIPRLFSVSQIVRISKTIQTPQNPKRLSNWALNISSRTFYMRFIFGENRFIRLIHPRRWNLEARNL